MRRPLGSGWFCHGFFMRTDEMVQLAALAATYGPGLVDNRRPPTQQYIEQYWTASKCRLDRWARSLGRFRSLPTAARRQSVHWREVEGVVEEVLAADVLTRVWSAVLTACDQAWGQQELEPVARSVMVGHLEARRQALGLLMHVPGVHLAHAVRVNQLRRKAERWTDLLLARLIDRHDVGQFAIEPERAADFAADLRDETAAERQTRWPLLLASLRLAFAATPSRPLPNIDLNEQIAASLLACLPCPRFDGGSLPLSLWRLQLAHTADSAQELLDELWQWETGVNGSGEE